jgi:hypothetical protein
VQLQLHITTTSALLTHKSRICFNGTDFQRNQLSPIESRPQSGTHTDRNDEQVSPRKMCQIVVMSADT